MPELVWTTRFDADVQEIYEWLDEWSENGGDRFYQRLLGELQQLIDRPWSGKRIRDSTALHLAVVGRRYAVIYLVEHRGIILDTLFDQRRDPELLAARIRNITGGLPKPTGET